jgi:hypothetical protein
MSNFVIAFLFSIGSSAWVYKKLLRTTGNNNKNAIIAATITGLVLLFIMYFVLNTIIKKG